MIAAMNRQKIKLTNVDRNEYRFEKSGILKNIGMLKYQNIGILEQQIIYSHNSLTVRINNQINKEIINGLINQLYN
jgi:hypothetical protein